MIPKVVVLAIAAYLLGGVPFGVIVGREWRGIDIRQFGSGNIGFANVLRTLGWGPALVVFLCDTGKGYLPVLAARQVTAGAGHAELWVVLIGVLAMAGHVFSPFLRFRGGRAVLTSLGVLVGISPWVALVGLAAAVTLILVTRYISVGSMVGAVLAAALAWVGWPQELSPVYATFITVAATIIILRHVPNIRRLLAGRELKTGRRPEQAAEPGGGAGERQ